MSTFCSTVRCARSACNNAIIGKEMIVGTSTNCSASCGARRTARIGTSSVMILGTSMTGSGTVVSLSKNRSTSCSLFHRLRHRSVESLHQGRTADVGRAMCSMVCRWTRSCGLGSARTPGRNPAVSSSNNSKITASPAALVLCLLSPWSSVRSLPGPVRRLCP